jgi:enoyl-CoA hydratase/carnithine racemase
MGKDEASEYEIRDRAAWIRMACPENRNALSTRLLGGLSQHLQTAMDDPVVRVIVLTGSDGVFCAGADLKSRGSGIADGAGDNAFVEILKRMREGPKPVICAVNGHAFGGGIGLIAAADIAIAVFGANFALWSEDWVSVISQSPVQAVGLISRPRISIHVWHSAQSEA